jgi:hypothetical protein
MLAGFSGKISEVGASYMLDRRSTNVSLAELVYEQVKALPEPLAREVLDFIGFLRERGERREWRDLMNAQAGSLDSMWDNPEDSVWDNV